jgi:hypothetical protein
MKKLFVLICGFFLLTLGCDKDRIEEDFQDNTAIQNIDGRWKVVSYEDYKTSSITVKTDVDSWNGMDVILTFSRDSLWGYCTSNSMSGKYSITGRNIHIISYYGTKVGQPEWGNMFSRVIYDIESFEINEHKLRFFYDDSEKSVTLSHD